MDGWGAGEEAQKASRPDLHRRRLSGCPVPGGGRGQGFPSLVQIPSAVLMFYLPGFVCLFVLFLTIHVLLFNNKV